MTRSDLAAERCATLLLAVLVDLLAGEPPNRWHPVAWLGGLLERLVGRLPRGSHPRELTSGLMLALGTLLLAGLVGAVLEHQISRSPRPARLLLGALALKTSLSVRALADEARAVERGLATGDLEHVRGALRALVSRQTADLGPDLLASAAIESLAENLSDSAFAPALFYLQGGLAGALAYRAANTLDAMIGYHGEYEYLGRAAARLDDLLNLAPARLCGLVLAAAALVTGDGPRAWRTLWRDHGRTASPNAGWPMSAAAGALGRRLEKVDHYVLGECFPSPEPTDLERAIRLYYRAVALGLGLLMLGHLSRSRPRPTASGA